MTDETPKRAKARFPAPASRKCLWYFQGLLNTEPRVALVTSDNRNGALELTVFGKGDRTPACISGSRHKDDPFHQQYPNHKSESGCWDYLPGDRPSANEFADALVYTAKMIEVFGGIDKFAKAWKEQYARLADAARSEETERPAKTK